MKGARIPSWLSDFGVAAVGFAHPPWAARARSNGTSLQINQAEERQLLPHIRTCFAYLFRKDSAKNHRGIRRFPEWVDKEAAIRWGSGGRGNGLRGRGGARCAVKHTHSWKDFYYTSVLRKYCDGVHRATGHFQLSQRFMNPRLIISEIAGPIVVKLCIYVKHIMWMV